MYRVIRFLLREWLLANLRRDEKHYLVWLLQKRAIQRAGFLVMLGLIVEFNTKGRLENVFPNQWITERRHEFESGLISWSKFKDCAQFRHMMN
jgi:hypothetical protein